MSGLRRFWRLLRTARNARFDRNGKAETMYALQHLRAASQLDQNQSSGKARFDSTGSDAADSGLINSGAFSDVSLAETFEP